MIIGNWKGTKWLVNDQPSGRNAEAVKFSFDDRGNYTYDYSGISERGIYRIENDKLYTTAKDQLEIMVKISKLSKDNLIFDMGRSGQLETLFLIRNN
jgi:hypothetical protein